jgi:hypothetical protein
VFRSGRYATRHFCSVVRAAPAVQYLEGLLPSADDSKRRVTIGMALLRALSFVMRPL